MYGSQFAGEWPPSSNVNNVPLKKTRLCSYDRCLALSCIPQEVNINLIIFSSAQIKSGRSFNDTSEGRDPWDGALGPKRFAEI
jgi:hypothetical protein